MNKGIIVAVAVLLVGGGVYAFTSSQSGSMKQEQMAMEEKMKMEEMKMAEEKMKMEAMKEKDMMSNDAGTMMKKDEMQKEEVSTAAGAYVAYAPEKIAMAETGDVVLFFHASWCPSCRGLNSDIEANVGAIPQGVTILKVNYDTETELKKKYGVTTQHTLVQVDKDGTLIKKWSGTPKLAALVTEIQ